MDNDSPQTWYSLSKQLPHAWVVADLEVDFASRVSLQLARIEKAIADLEVKYVKYEKVINGLRRTHRSRSK